MARDCFAKILSQTDANSYLEVPKSALYLPPSNSIIPVLDQNGYVWEFKAPAKPSSGRRTLRGTWPQFAKTYFLRAGDAVKLSYDPNTNQYFVEFQKQIPATLPLFV
ncbi:hypothetical protein LOK49_LG07G01012 [Camellia lanceoleosa]|uniref:Uncharacterized protein n=1 Tax=Camellia lanceoleosa TaxID=1840588 RepID=A0ACC0H190_9ERIC|nr:hypothetical protein LOK49_LG07G01012 [Camellia lanceoleosa]